MLALMNIKQGYIVFNTVFSPKKILTKYFKEKKFIHMDIIITQSIIYKLHNVYFSPSYKLLKTDHARIIP